LHLRKPDAPCAAQLGASAILTINQESQERAMSKTAVASSELAPPVGRVQSGNRSRSRVFLTSMSDYVALNGIYSTHFEADATLAMK
jgi:hypothetical protein